MNQLELFLLGLVAVAARRQPLVYSPYAWKVERDFWAASLLADWPLGLDEFEHRLLRLVRP